MYLQNNLDAIKDDQYALSQVAYVLQMVQSEKAERAFEYFKNFMQNSCKSLSLFFLLKLFKNMFCLNGDLL